MGLLSNLLGGDGNGSGNERPPKPEPTDGTKQLERTRYEATVEYRNGDVETFECYGIYSRGETRVEFNTDPYAKACLYDGTAEHRYDRRKINYETLAREPELTEVATDTFVITYTEDYEWSTGSGYSSIRSSYDWHPEHKDIELEVIRGD